MNDWIYVGAVLFGAFSLLIEADRNFRTTLSNHPFPYHAILEKVELENLCTPREWRSGFLFYSLLYLLTYGVILSSTELFLLVRNANLAELQVGAHTNFVGPLSDPMELSDTTYGKPIFVSAFLIAFFSLGAMKPVETYMRALAHRLAGVPRGVYKVLERLQTAQYLKLNAKYPSPLLKKFGKTIEDAKFLDVSDQYTADIRTQLSAIDCLSPSVTAGFSRLHFPLTHFDAFKEVPRQLANEVAKVDELIDGLEPNETSLKSLHEHAVLASNSAKAVFAVFYVRNNHAIKNTDPKSPIAAIEKLIARGYRTELNSFAMSMFIGVMISMVITFFAYHNSREEKVNNKPLLAETEIQKAWKDAAPERQMVLQAAVSVEIDLAEGTEAKVTFLEGTAATETLIDGESREMKLQSDKASTIGLPKLIPKTFKLAKGRMITITQLPEADLTPQSGLVWKEGGPLPGVMLPPETQGDVLLFEDLVLELPAITEATVALENGNMATVVVAKKRPFSVTLKKGSKVAVTITKYALAIPDPKTKDQHVLPLTSTEEDKMLALPTWLTCMASLNAAAKNNAKTGPEGAEPLNSAQVSAPCGGAKTRGEANWLTGQYQRIISWSFWDVFQRALMVFATIVATIFFREVRVDQNSWKPWSFKRIPFLRLLSMSFVPALIGIFALSSAYVVQLVWNADFDVTQRQMTVLFQGNWVYFAWHLLPCMSLSIGALILMDKHDDWLVEITIFVGALFSLILIALSLLIYMVNSSASGAVGFQFPSMLGGWTITSDALRDTIVTATLPAMFIFLFGVFLELTEDHRGSQWLTGRILTPPISFFKSLIGPRVFATVLYLIGLAALVALLWSLLAGTPAQAATLGESSTPEESDTNTHDADNTPKILLRIGVRSDARPFSYKSDRNFDVLTAATPGPLAKDKYTGFMIKICDAVLTDLLVNPMIPAKAGAPAVPAKDDAPAIPAIEAIPAVKLERENIEIVDVDKLVAGNKEKSRFDYFGDEFDVLCDPSTITNERRTGLILSPPLFLSGISFIDLPNLRKPKQDLCPDYPLVGLVGNTTAASSGIRAILEADELPRYRNLLIDWLDDGKSKCSKESEDYKAVKVFASHSAAAKSFCEGNFHYYLGDQEIITYNARQVPGCEFDQAGRTFTTDRYAIFGKIDYSDPGRALWVARFFEVLSQKVPFSPSILDTAFSDTFIGTDKSRALELFFWSVRGEH